MEPVDHAIGRSRGGLTTKLHSLVDGHGLPLVIEAGPGQGGDSPMLPVLLERLRVPRCGPGRARTRPDALLADKAYSSRAHRALLRERGIKAVIPERSDQQNHRLRRGSAGGRPVSYDTELYKGRNVVERRSWRATRWAGPSPSCSPAAPGQGRGPRALRDRAGLARPVAARGLAGDERDEGRARRVPARGVARDRAGAGR